MQFAITFNVFLYIINKNKMRKSYKWIKIKINICEYMWVQFNRKISKTRNCIKNDVLNSFQKTISNSTVIEILISFSVKEK